MPGSTAILAAAALRPYAVANIAASGPNKTTKQDLLAVFNDVDARVGVLEGAAHSPALTSGQINNPSFDCTPAINALYLLAVATGCRMYFPAGRYYCLTPLLFDLKDVASYGLVIYGDGLQKSIIDTSMVTTSPTILFFNSATPGDNDFLYISNIAFSTSINGALIQLGSEDFHDPVNVPIFDNVWLGNDNSGGSATCLELNYVLGGFFRCVVNCNYGAFGAVHLRQSCFNVFVGSYGTANCSIVSTDGTSYGNHFIAPDFENVINCVQAASGDFRNNVFTAGQWSYSSAGYVDQVGTSNVIIAPNPNPLSPGTPNSFIGGRGTGVTLEGSNQIFSISTPGIASGTEITNTSGFRVMLEMWGTITTFSKNGYTRGAASPFISTILVPGDTFSYSGTATMIWTII